MIDDLLPIQPACCTYAAMPAQLHVVPLIVEHGHVAHRTAKPPTVDASVLRAGLYWGHATNWDWQRRAKFEHASVYQSCALYTACVP
jgi:hypothetical protein